MNNPPLDSALWWLSTSNVLYVTGAVLTVLTAAWVVYETRAVALGRHPKFFLLSEIFAAVAATICLAGTIGAIHFGNLVGHLKDVDLETYKTQAGIQIAQANQRAADANRKAQEARDKAVEAENENLKLHGQVSSDAALARTAEAALTKANKETSDFAHALAQQQGAMAEQARVSPILAQYQIEQLAKLLQPFSGQSVAIHSTSDTTVLRLGATVSMALNKAGIDTKQNMIDMGALYQGVSVAVHSPQDVPPLANALIVGLRQAGIDAHPVSVPNRVPEGKVALFMGPN